MLADGLLIARGARDLYLLPRMANRHGLVAGATGTGKTVSLQVMAENFSRIGVPVFMADVKGDLAGISQPGSITPKLSERIKLLRLDDYAFEGCPVRLWDVFGEQGHPVRTTISDLGPLLLSRLLNLNDIQSGVLTIVFRVADENGLLLLDFKDLRSMVQYVGDHSGEFETEYGHISTASVGTIQRGLLALEDQGADKIFGEPALDLDDLIQTDEGRGVVNILAADRLMQSPRAYSTFLLWLLSELFEHMPEVGDQDKPRLVFFFDEAHLLFTDAPQPLLEKIEQVVRLIRSKGVGVYFVTQNPLDIPDATLTQLGNRIQHALRAFTPRDQKAVRAAAETFRQNPKINVETAITELAVGEGLISFLDEKGMPGVVDRAFVLPPKSQIGPIAPPIREQIIRQSVLFGRYDQLVDRQSAYEILKSRVQRRMPEAPQPGTPVPPPYSGEDPQQQPRRAAGRPRETLVEAMVKSAARAASSQIGRQIIRNILGSVLGGRR